MRRLQPNIVKFACLTCETSCVASVYPPMTQNRDYPGEPMEITDLTGCRHVLTAWEEGGRAFDQLYDLIYRQAEDDAEAARERYYEQKGDLKREEEVGE